jgi:hypothetical protein
MRWIRLSTAGAGGSQTTHSPSLWANCSIEKIQLVLAINLAWPVRIDDLLDFSPNGSDRESGCVREDRIQVGEGFFRTDALLPSIGVGNDFFADLHHRQAGNVFNLVFLARTLSESRLA